MKKIISQIHLHPQASGEQRGRYCERYTAILTDTILTWHFSNTPFNEGSDIEPLKMSVKSARFTLASTLHGDTKEEKITDYFERTASTSWAYVARNGNIYIMNKTEFTELLNQFCSLQRASTKNGGQMTVRMRTETKKMREWLEGQVN